MRGLIILFPKLFVCAQSLAKLPLASKNHERLGMEQMFCGRTRGLAGIQVRCVYKFAKADNGRADLWPLGPLKPLLSSELAMFDAKLCIGLHLGPCRSCAIETFPDGQIVTCFAKRAQGLTKFSYELVLPAGYVELNSSKLRWEAC